MERTEFSHTYLNLKIFWSHCPLKGIQNALQAVFDIIHNFFNDTK